MTAHFSSELDGTRYAISALLGALGFESMARDVQTETDGERLGRYARVVLKNTADPRMRRELMSRFVALRLVVPS